VAVAETQTTTMTGGTLPAPTIVTVILIEAANVTASGIVIVIVTVIVTDLAVIETLIDQNQNVIVAMIVDVIAIVTMIVIVIAIVTMIVRVIVIATMVVDETVRMIANAHAQAHPQGTAIVATSSNLRSCTHSASRVQVAKTAPKERQS